MQYTNVDFGDSPGQVGQIKIRYSRNYNHGGRLEVRRGGPTGQVIGNFLPTYTGSHSNFEEVYFPITDSIQGVQSITFKAYSHAPDYALLDIEWWQLAPPHEFPSKPPLLCKEGGDFASSSGNLVTWEGAGTTVGNIDNNEWMKYSNIDFGEAGTFSQILIRFSKDGGTPNGKLQVTVDGTIIGNYVNPPITGSWDTYVEIPFPITGSFSGIKDVYFTALDTNFGFMNIEWWALIP